MLVGLLTLSAAADPTWDLIGQGRPGLARQLLKQPTLLQSAQIAQAEGDVGEAWRLVRQLEPTYQPGHQPAEFFWLRAQLLRDSQWQMAQQNLRGVVGESSPPQVRLLGLIAMAQGLDRQTETAAADEYWIQAAHLASDMKPQRGAWVIHVALAQADRQIQKDRHDQALMTLVNARALAQAEKLPALLALVQLKVAETEAELADWEAFADNCEGALKTAAPLDEPWLIERICTYWVDQQLQRSTDVASTRRCLRVLQATEKTLRGPARLHLLSFLARLQWTGLNQKTEGLATLDRAVELCPPSKLEMRLLAERYLLTPGSDPQARRRQLLHIQEDLTRLGPLQPEDVVSKKIPPYGIWAALAETYLPGQPEQAEQLFKKALELSPDRTARLHVLCFQMFRCSQLGAMPMARRSLQELLALLASPLDAKSVTLVGDLMVELDSGSRNLSRLYLTDDPHPPAESPVVVFLHEMLANSDLQLRLDRGVYDQIRQAKSPQDGCRAYLGRARLLMAQGRNPEAGLAAEKMGELAHKGGLSRQEAQALRLQAELRWSMGFYDRAIEACQQAEAIYAASASALDQENGQDCRRLRAYFLMRSGRVREGLALCQGRTDPWSIFLSGRCFVELGQRTEAQAAFARCHFSDDLLELGRLVFQARCSDQPDELYRAAYELGKRRESLLVREVCLDWAASLRRTGREAEAVQLEEETRARLTRLFQQFPVEVRERLLDQPLTQKLFPGQHTQAVTDNRQSRRGFLAALNEVRQRYPRMDNEMGVSASDLVALQEIVPADRVLVQYFAGEADLYAMRVDSQGCRLIPMAVEKEVLRGWIHELRVALSQRKALPELAARRLYACLVGSLGPDLEGKQVQVIPSGLFWYLPWDVLQDSQGHFLVEKLEWSCVSPAELMRSRFAPAGATASGGQLVALGGSNPDLPATAEEARMVSQLFVQSRALVGEEATGQNLVRWALQADILHIATHSGLSAGLNQTYIELSDGPFTLEQVYGLHLRPQCRVVLSSCESALGQSDPGREVSSLATAFLVGGASSVVATLWRVEDETSKAFFRRFYARLLETGSTSKALRQARLDSLAEPPWGWGAYQLIGQP